MIWDPATARGRDESVILAQLTSEIADVCGDPGLVDADKVRELAAAIATYLRAECPEAIEAVNAKYLVMLASRAFASLGDGRTARRLVVFGTGLVKPSAWDVSGEHEIWVLDLKEMTVRENAPIELIFFSSLNIVLEAMAEVWDETRGQGTLGLRHVLPTAAALLGVDDGHRNSRSLGAEIQRACGQKLEQIRGKRGWTGIPRIMNLDI